MKKKIIKIKQHDISDCGAACLASVSKHYGFDLPISRIRQYASTDKKGTNALGMVEAAEKLCFIAKGVKGNLESLFEIPIPSIAHCIIGHQLHHFVVIYEVTKKYILIMDPADGKIHKLKFDDFQKKWSGVLILLLPSEDFQKGNIKTSIFKRFWQLIRPHKLIMAQVLFGSVIYTLLGLSSAVYIQKIVDHVFINGNYNLLNLMSTIMIVLLLLQVFIGSQKSLYALRTGQRIDSSLILNYYKHLMTLPQKFFDTMRIGEIISRINDAVKIRTFINNTSIDLIVNVFIIIFSLSLMFLYSLKLALLFSGIFPLYFLVFFIVNKVNKKYQRRIMENNAGLESQLVESITSVSTIKRFGLEWFADLKTENRFIQLLKSIYISGKNSIFTSSSSEFLSRVFTIILLWVGSILVIDRVITPGKLMSFYTLIGYLTRPISSLLHMNGSIQDAIIAADRLYEIMDLEIEVSSNKIKLLPEMIDDIEFRNVTFHYQNRVPIFNSLNLKIPKEKITAIVGESGSGKTTLLSLMQNIYQIDNGQILIGHYDTNYITLESLRSLIGVVPQQIDLFSGSVIENIALGDFNPNMKKIMNICRDLGIIDFIEKLPAGFNTYIGENGANLSGGEKQRLAMARALYKNPKILILDEATSSLDSFSELKIQKLIKQLRNQKKTIILISHHFKSIVNADKIIFIHKGQVVEEGTHKHLFNRKSYYYSLWRQQFPTLNTYPNI